MLDNQNHFSVKQLSVGSLEVILGCAAIATNIIIPIILHKPEPESYINVNFNSSDPEIVAILEGLERGYYGTTFDQRFEAMAEQLTRRGYNIEAERDNIYRITNAAYDNFNYSRSVRRIKRT